MPKEPTRSNLKNMPIQARPNVEDEIRRRAYEIYEERGGEHGHDLDDWVRAEAEVTGTTVQARA